MRTTLLIAVAFVISSTAANAATIRSHHHHHRHHHHHHHRSTHSLDLAGSGVAGRTVIGHRPAGCPHAWCGCGLAHYLGIHDTRLNLAWNWARMFPRTSAHSHAAAVRHGHVMLLESPAGGTHWLVRDFNGGRGLAWLHVRDVRGYVFVDPSRQLAGGS